MAGRFVLRVGGKGVSAKMEGAGGGRSGDWRVWIGESGKLGKIGRVWREGGWNRGDRGQKRERWGWIDRSWWKERRNGEMGKPEGKRKEPKWKRKIPRGKEGATKRPKRPKRPSEWNGEEEKWGTERTEWMALNPWENPMDCRPWKPWKQAESEWIHSMIHSMIH